MGYTLTYPLSCPTNRDHLNPTSGNFMKNPLGLPELIRARLTDPDRATVALLRCPMFRSGSRAGPKPGSVLDVSPLN